MDIKLEGLGEDGKPEKKPRRKHNRFNGMSEEEVMKRLLPDLILPDLDILIVSISMMGPWEADECKELPETAVSRLGGEAGQWR